MPPERAASTMEALAEPDRLKVQRLVDQLSLQKGPRHTSPRSLSGSPRSKRALRSPSSSGHQYFQVRLQPGGGPVHAFPCEPADRDAPVWLAHCQACRLPVAGQTGGWVPHTV